MGVCFVNNKSDVNMSYIGFGMVRIGVAYAIDKKLGQLYENNMKAPINKEVLTDEDYEYMKKITPQPLNVFLWHSDCDGYFSKRDVKAIYKELIKLNPKYDNEIDDERYNKLLNLFSQEERIDLH